MNAESIKAFDMPPELEARWEVLFAQARRLIEAGDGQGGLESAKQAWEVIPEPKLRCSMSYITLMRMVRGFAAARAYQEGIEMMAWVLAHDPPEREVPVFQVQKGILEFEAGLL